ncbi:transcription factor SPT20 homolog [Harpegnathos saltator]|uniref:Protein FAM48A n=1 Tax=Harpegnathos saltator TaxID=610380 RepID=E2B3F9_HARSA|nr:transcription factor SPT20 homolog [Harpegnathos saltator]XP_011136900.1 transcription factor SPT20 homolog [Harpegnathos saltator]XP_011136911.1 transcription factor SPT20 homolog [Harpegnathos saltator]EFN89837.1 Protein FAM48A [Harpegnathos saltator]
MSGLTICLEDAYQQAQDMINQAPRYWLKNVQGQNSLALTPDKSLSSQKKEQSHSRHSIHAKLTRLYFEELAKVPHATPDSVLNNLENECDLLGLLVRREGLHTLIVNLYAGNKGYSLAVRNSDKGNQYDKNSLAETQLMGYEQGELLSCIDNGQLPAMLAEQLESNHSHLFYDGCIVAEVRDYRKACSYNKADVHHKAEVYHNRAEIHHVLLKPTTQSILSDVSTLTSDGDWSHEERLILESHLLAATQGPLCLDPNPIPTLASTRVKQSKSLFTDPQLIRQAKKFSQVTVNRKRKLEQMIQSEGPTIQDFMQKIRAKRGMTSTACVAPSITNPPLLPPNTPVDVLRLAKAYERPRETKDCSPQVIEEYILEAPGSQGELDHIKLSILQRPSTSEYLGELYMDKNHREGEKNGSSCRFTLGTRAVANHYYQQFKEIFTEEGRKNVVIKHLVPGQVPRTCTPVMQRVHQQVQQAKAAQLVAQQLQQTQSQHVAQQILSRAQGQLNTLAGQVASKAMTEATTSVQNNLPYVDTTNMPQITSQNDVTTLSSGQSLTNGGPNASTSVQIDNSSLAVADNTCNGPGFLVFQKSSNTINNATPNSVPVLQAQLQAGTQNCINETANQNQNEPPFKKHTNNPAISALVTSLMNSAQQFQQQAAANAAAAAMNNNNAQTSNKSNNAAILSLLNSTPANITPQKLQPRRISLNTSIPPRVISHGNVINVPNTTGQVRVSLSSALSGQLSSKQQHVKATAVRLARVQDVPTSTLGLSMPGLSALLAGTPSADNPIPGMNPASSLLERLTASSSQSSQPASPMTSPSPTGNVNLQGVNLTSLPNSINGLQNVQVSFPGLSQPITMSLNVSATTGGSVTPTGVIVSLPISSATNTCTTVSSMVPATVVTTAIAGSTPTVVIANPANAHLSLPIGKISEIAHAQIIASGVKGLSQQNIRNNNAVTLAQGGQAIQLIGSQRPRLNNMPRQVQSNQVKSAVLSNQLVTVAKTVTASQLILSGNKQVLAPIMAATKPVLMASQTTPSSQVVPVNKQTLLTKSLHARTSTGQCNQQTQSLGVTTLSQQQLQQLQQCLAAQHKVAVATGSSQSRTHIEAQRNSTSAPGEDPA